MVRNWEEDKAKCFWDFSKAKYDDAFEAVFVLFLQIINESRCMMHL